MNANEETIYGKVMRNILFLVYLITYSLNSYGVSAGPFIHKLSQPDGVTFEARQWGDEFYHGWETKEGYTILFDEKIQCWVYAIRGKGGVLESSGKVVGKDQPTDIPLRVRPSKEIIFSKREEVLKFQELQVGIKGIPLRGTAKLLVILINFADTTTTYGPSDFQNLLFGSSGRTMASYYEEVSGGLFSVSLGSAGIKGWYTASREHDYYSSWEKSKELVFEAAQLADSAVDFREYDQDGDGYVDVVGIVHQGAGQEFRGDTTDIWSHMGSINPYTTQDGVKVRNYFIVPETLGDSITTIGVFVHEYEHALGLPDLYDSDDDSGGVGIWSVMASGCWLKISLPSDCPAHLDAWSKYRLGWVNPITVPSPFFQTVTISPIENGGSVYKIGYSGGAMDGEYFLIENRQQLGFDAKLPGSGLLIWHIDGNILSTLRKPNYNQCVMVDEECCADTHYGVALMQADGNWDLERNINRGNCGDPYPGCLNKTLFTPDTNPSSDWYGCINSGVYLNDIRLVVMTLLHKLYT